MSAVVTDVRCPTGASSLMGRLVSTDGEMDPEGLEGLLLQLHCRECTKDFRRIQPLVLRVLHLYTLLGCSIIHRLCSGMGLRPSSIWIRRWTFSS